MLKIREDNYCKGCYHYSFKYKNSAFYTYNYLYTFTAIGYTKRWARKKLRERYPFLNELKIKFI